jgi:hypothetical protein
MTQEFAPRASTIQKRVVFALGAGLIEITQLSNAIGVSMYPVLQSLRIVIISTHQVVGLRRRGMMTTD